VDQIKATVPLTAIAVYLASVNKGHDRRVLGKGLGSVCEIAPRYRFRAYIFVCAIVLEKAQVTGKKERASFLNFVIANYVGAVTCYLS
jgi:hypothetical protein